MPPLLPKYQDLNILPVKNMIHSWQAAADAYKNTMLGFNSVCSREAATNSWFLLHRMVLAYRQNLKYRTPRNGDVLNLSHLHTHIKSMLVDNMHLAETLHMDQTAWLGLLTLHRDCLLHCIQFSIYDVDASPPPISYAGSLDEFGKIENALALIEDYYLLDSPDKLTIDLSPLAKMMQYIAKQLSEGFSDYNDGTFDKKFEEITLRLGKLHLSRRE